MSMAAHPVLEELSRAGRVYAVLDGARDRGIRRFVMDSRAAAWCLWRGPLPAPMEDAAPYLLRLDPGADYVDRFFAAGWRNAWGVLLAAEAPSRELRSHLRRFLRVRSPEGKVMLFRWYDPRVLRVFLPALKPADAAEFFGPVAAFAAEGESPDAVHVFRRAA